MTRVVWTNIEKQLVIERMVALLREDPNLTNTQVLQRAQEVLPRYRRLVISHAKVFTHKPKIEEARQKARSLGKPVEPPPPINIAPEPPKREETPTERLAGVLDALLDIVADKLADRIAQRLQVQIETQTVTTTESPYRPRHNPEPLPTPAKSCRPGVLVLGLLSQSGEQMRREFGHRLDIQWYDTDDATTRQVHPMAHVVMMTKFVNHSVQERWRKAGVLHYCNGGVSQLREILANL